MASEGVFHRLGKCEVCNDQEAKYTCPRCEVKTCCLGCVNNHKQELQCNGQRNKVAFKPISQFSNLDLLSDYRLLEETTRRVERYVRNPTKQYTGTKELPINLFRLRAAAHRRRTTLQFLPHNFSRSKSNSTYFNWKEQLIYWRVEWIFPQAGNIKCVGSRSLENEPLSKLLNIYLDPKSCDPMYLDKLQYYQSAGHGGVLLLLKAEKRTGSQFYQLDCSLSLKKNLKEKTIIEYPTIYVVLKDHKDAFDIITPDEEDLEENTSLNQNAGRRMKNKNNFLFSTSDHSDSEVEDVHRTEDQDASYSRRKRKYRKLNIPNYDVLIRQKS